MEETFFDFFQNGGKLTIESEKWGSACVVTFTIGSSCQLDNVPQMGVV